MEINIEQLRAQESNIITSFLEGNDMAPGEEKKFIDSFKGLKDEEKNLALHRMASMLPEFQEMLQGDPQEMSFNINPIQSQPPEQSQGQPAQEQQAQEVNPPTAQQGGLLLDTYLAKMGGTADQIDVAEFRNYLKSI